MKYILLLICYVVLCNITIEAQHKLMGKIVDEHNHVLTGATIFLRPINKGTVSDNEGSYKFNSLNSSNYMIEVSFLGYKTFKDSLYIDKDQNLDIQLELSSLHLQEVVIKDHYAEKRKKEESLNVEVVDANYLKQNLSGSIAKSLSKLPGVSSIDIGSGQSKPVIRGMSFNRVVVVENNIKHEAQQWGTDHGLEIDQYAIDNVAVIKGPASLIYGSDAIGGVIDMKNRRIPTKHSFGGSIDLSGKTNNNSIASSISLKARAEEFYANVRATIVDYGDYKVPTDFIDIYSYKASLQDNFVRNTAGNELNFHGNIGYVTKQFVSKLFISNVSSKNGFFANAHGLEPRNVDTDLHDKSNRDINLPRQESNHIKLTNSNSINFQNFKLNIDLGFQHNLRQEYSKYVNHGYMPSVLPNNLGFKKDLDREFEKFVYSTNLNLQHKINQNTKIIWGINSEFQHNQIGGFGFIIPEFKQLTSGLFLIGKHSFSSTQTIQVGLRYDYGNIQTQEYSDWFSSPISEDNPENRTYLKRAQELDKSYYNLSWSIGYNLTPKDWFFKLNIGKSFRMPLPKELAANGVNYHRFSFEVGNINLNPEESYQLDLGFEYNKGIFAIGLSPFMNYFTNYIYLNPTSNHDRLYGNGNQIFNYTQAEVFRYGAELYTNIKILKTLEFGLTGEYLYSEQLTGEKKGYTLPFSPPASAVLSIKYSKPQWGYLKTPYLSMGYRLTASQDNIVPPEVKTPSYGVLNLGMGGVINFYNTDFNIALQVQNVLNSKYFNHTSFYRLINVPEQGRNIILNLSLNF